MAGDAGEWEDWDFPPPPPPPTSFCGGGSPEMYCHLVEGGTVGARFNGAAFPTLPIVAVCSSVVLVALLVAAFLFWRHKTKAPNLLPCKNEQQGHLGDMGTANGVTYEDVLANHHPTRIPQGRLGGSQTLMPLEILDIKLGDPVTPLHHVPCYQSRDPSHILPFHPVYEEVSQATLGDKSTTENGKLGGRSLTSDDEYPVSGEGSGQCSATSSVRGSTGGDLCRDPVSSEDEDMVPSGDDKFTYPSRQHMHPSNSNRIGRNPVQSPPQTTYPLAGRTVNHLGHVSHSTDCGGKRSNVMPPWRTRQPDNFPTSASQENIYSTIDEDDLVDYPVQPPPPSLACPPNKLSSVMSQKKHLLPRGDHRAIPPLSQRNTLEENGSSYGDMMPTFHSPSAFM